MKVCGQHMLTAGIHPCYVTAPGDNRNCSFAPMVLFLACGIWGLSGRKA